MKLNSRTIMLSICELHVNRCSLELRTHSLIHSTHRFRFRAVCKISTTSKCSSVYSSCAQSFKSVCDFYSEYGTWDAKTLHVWCSDTGVRKNRLKLLSVTGTHSTITAVAFSHKYRLYLVVTQHFKFIFLNEHFATVTTIHMPILSTVNFVHWNDGQDQLVTAGIKGVFIHNFKYTSKYAPKLAANIDLGGKNINVEFIKKRHLDPVLPWIKGMKVDTRNSIIMTWS